MISGAALAAAVLWFIAIFLFLGAGVWDKDEACQPMGPSSTTIETEFFPPRYYCVSDVSRIEAISPAPRSEEFEVSAQWIGGVLAGGLLMMFSPAPKRPIR